MAADYFLKIDGIDGESLDAKNKGAIEIESWSWSAENKTTVGSATGGAGTGKATLEEFTFEMKPNKASAKLLLACASGQHFKTVTLIGRMSGKETEYLKITLGMVFVISFSASGSGGDDAPTEQVSFAYGKILYEYKEQRSDGTLGPAIVSGWDVTTNKSIASIV